MAITFTGDAYTIKWKKTFYDLCRLNELGPNNSEYELSWAGTPESGYTFGVCQHDIAGNTNAYNTIRDIIINSTDNNGNYIIFPTVTTNRGTNQNIIALLNLVDDRGGVRYLQLKKV